MSEPAAFEFRWAAAADEPDIRSLVDSVAMPGAVSIRFAREPDYFLGTTIMGDTCDVLIAQHRSSRQLVGIACRAERKAYINGKKARLGYIGQVRVAPEFEGHWLIQRGVRYFRKAGSAELVYLGVIASDNPAALRIFAGPRLLGGLLIRHLCSLTTCAILLRPRRVRSTKGIEISTGSRETLAEIVRFLEGESSKRQLFPAYTLGDFTEGKKMRGLDPADIIVARRAGEIVGVLAVWDQSNYKQDIIESYGEGLRRLTPLYNLAARVLRARPLTPPGEEIPMGFAACVCVAGDEVRVMENLLSAATANAFERGKNFLMIGLADHDPLLPVARRYLHIPYRSELFIVSWSNESLAQVDERVPYIEIATL